MGINQGNCQQKNENFQLVKSFKVYFSFDEGESDQFLKLKKYLESTLSGYVLYDYGGNEYKFSSHEKFSSYIINFDVAIVVLGEKYAQNFDENRKKEIEIIKENNLPIIPILVRNKNIDYYSILGEFAKNNNFERLLHPELLENFLTGLKEKKSISALKYLAMLYKEQGQKAKFEKYQQEYINYLRERLKDDHSLFIIDEYFQSLCRYITSYTNSANFRACYPVLRDNFQLFMDLFKEGKSVKKYIASFFQWGGTICSCLQKKKEGIDYLKKAKVLYESEKLSENERYYYIKTNFTLGMLYLQSENFEKGTLLINDVMLMLQDIAFDIMEEFGETNKNIAKKEVAFSAITKVYEKTINFFTDYGMYQKAREYAKNYADFFDKMCYYSIEKYTHYLLRGYFLISKVSAYDGEWPDSIYWNNRAIKTATTLKKREILGYDVDIYQFSVNNCDCFFAINDVENTVLWIEKSIDALKQLDDSQKLKNINKLYNYLREFSAFFVDSERDEDYDKMQKYCKYLEKEIERLKKQ